MTAEKNDMGAGEPPKADLQKILEAFKDTLSETARAQFESGAPDDPFFKDAVEGLQGLKNKEDLPKVISRLNQQLQHHIAHHKGRDRKKKLRYGDWIYWAIALILLLAFAGFMVLRLLLKH
jgi:hypothetical protein